MKNKTLDEIKKSYAEKPNVLKSIYLFCLFTSVFLFSPLINIVLELTPDLHDFSSHVISNASIKNFDIGSRIKLYFLSFVLIAVFSSVSFVLFFKYLNSKYIENEVNKKSLQAVFNFSLIGIAAVFAGFFIANVDIVLVFIFILGGFLLISTTKSKRYWDIENAFWLLIMAIPFSLVFTKIVQHGIPPENHQALLKIEGTLFPVYNIGLIFSLLLLGTTGFLLFFLKQFFNGTDSEENYLHRRNCLYFATIPVSFIVIAESLMLEFFNVLNLKYNYLFNSPRLLFVVLSVIAILCSILLYFIKNKKKFNGVSKTLTTYHFPLLIIGITMMMVQPWRMFQPENEFFEFANHGISVDHFFRYGSIPIVENYDAHMFSTQIFGYLYGFINGYEPWAAFLYYNSADVIYSILVYFIFRHILGSKTALVFLLCFPIIGLVINTFTMLCLVALSLNYLIKDNTRKARYWFWLSILFTCLFRLDLGFAALLGGVVGYFSISYLLKKALHLKKVLITGSIVFGSALALFMVLCLIKSINPIMRLKEFLIISSSNQNFAYHGVGDTSHIAFRICYYFLPLLLVLLLLNVLLKSWISKTYVHQILENKKNQAAFVFFIFFATAYLFNLPRGIVRHSYLENILNVVVGCLPLALLCLIYIKRRANNLVFFLSAFVGMYVLTSLNIKSYKDKETSLFSKGLYSVPFLEKFTDVYSFNGTRTRVTFSLSEVNHFKKILNTVLQPNETYFDFSSNNYYHALVGRKNPVYVNQSPILLNGDISQETAISQIKQANVALVLMPNKNTKWKVIDMIETGFKYYLISEYVYQNYVPLMNMNSFDIYVRKDKQKQFNALLKAKLGSVNNSQLNDFSSIDQTKVQNHNVVTEIAPDKTLVIKSSGDDPFVFGILNQMSGYDLLNKNAAVRITLKVNVSALGTFQVYYQLPGDENFKEENSKRFTLDKVGEHELQLDLPSCPVDLRLDLEMPEINLKQIALTSSEAAGFQLPQIANMNLEELPRVWAEQSSKELFEKVPNLDEILKQSSVTMLLNSNQLKTKAYYLFIECEATANQLVAVELFDAQNNQKGLYNFNTQPGKHQYALRLSADYYWWNANLTKLSFSTSAAVVISKFALIASDGSAILPYKPGGLTLSNITDQNWQGGIGLGTQQNLLLFDNSKRINLELNKGEYIELIDGSRIKMESKETAGDFIKITISQNIDALKPKLQYPNNIKIVK